MRFHPAENRTGFPTSGYPFLPEGSEDKERIDAAQRELAGEKPAHDLTKRRRTRHHTVEQEGTS